MKKQIILLILLTINFPSWCQKEFTSTVLCSDSLLMSIKGQYEKINDVIFKEVASVLPKAQQPEALRRMDAMHQMLLEAFPEPKGLVGYWHRYMNNYLFAPNLDNKKGIPVCNYRYSCWYGQYKCLQDYPKQVAFTKETNSSLDVDVNGLSLPNSTDAPAPDTILINGERMYLMYNKIGSWKGHDLYGEGNFRMVILHRNGEMPFLPVTRKQYLDYALNIINKFYDDMIKDEQLLPAESGKETIRNTQEMKNKAIKKYKQELENSRDNNLLDLPALVIDTQIPVTGGTPYFSTDSDGGRMLVTINAAYMKKKQPKYIPQVIEIFWKWLSDAPKFGGAQGEYFRKMLEANFPIEKLQAMIDK